MAKSDRILIPASLGQALMGLRGLCLTILHMHALLLYYAM
jgi:hypothetical protein